MDSFSATGFLGQGNRCVAGKRDSRAVVVRAQDVQAFVEADHMQGSSCEEHRDRIWAGNKRGTTYEERLEYIVRDGEKIS